MCHEKSWRTKGGVDGLDLGRQEVFCLIIAMNICGYNDYYYEYKGTKKS